MPFSTLACRAMLLLLATIAGHPALAHRTHLPAIEAAWVQIVPRDLTCSGPHCEAQALLRVVVAAGVGCPAGLARAGTPDGRPLPLRRRANPRPDRFPIDVCEAALPLTHPGAVLADGTRLGWRHLAEGTPHRIAILGDTGCKPPGQSCTDPQAWPLAQVATAAAAPAEGPPDLVIHVGDYRYRGVDRWEDWRDDVFRPTAKLLRAAPWVMARGNHENCYQSPKGTRTGQGWMFLLAPMPGKVPPCRWGAQETVIEPPYALDLGELRLAVLDSADARYRCAAWGDDFTATHLPRFRSVLGTPGREAWLVTHYVVFDPTFAADTPCGGKPPMPAAYRTIVSDAIAAAGLRTVLSGDMHALGVVRAAGAGNGITQFVAGHGGVDLETLPAAAAAAPGLRCAAGFGPFALEARFRQAHGFLAAIREAGWRFTMRGPALAGEPTYPTPPGTAAALPACTAALP